MYIELELRAAFSSFSTNILLACQNLLEFPYAFHRTPNPNLEPRVSSVLIEILQDSINSGASIGYLPPFPDSSAKEYWLGVLEKVKNNSSLLWVAKDAELGVVGTVQLELASKTNALHRAEVCKLLVHNKARRRGVARALMLELIWALENSYGHTACMTRDCLFSQCF